MNDEKNCTHSELVNRKGLNQGVQSSSYCNQVWSSALQTSLIVLT